MGPRYSKTRPTVPHPHTSANNQSPGRFNAEHRRHRVVSTRAQRVATEPPICRTPNARPVSRPPPRLLSQGHYSSSFCSLSLHTSRAPHPKTNDNGAYSSTNLVLVSSPSRVNRSSCGAPSPRPRRLSPPLASSAYKSTRPTIQAAPTCATLPQLPGPATRFRSTSS